MLIRLGVSLLVSLGASAAFLLNHWVFGSLVVRYPDSWIAIALLGVIVTAAIFVVAGYVGSRQSRSGVGRVVAGVLPPVVALLVPRLIWATGRPILEDVDAPYLLASLMGAAAAWARDRAIQDQLAPEPDSILGESRSKTVKGSGIWIGLGALAVVDAVTQVLMRNVPFDHVGQLIATLVPPAVVAGLAVALAGLRPRQRSVSVGMAVGLVSYYVLGFLWAGLTGPHFSPEEDMAAINLEATVRAALEHASDESFQQIDAEFLNSIHGTRLMLDFVSANRSSPDPFTISVKPIDSRTWGAAAQSEDTGHCFILLARRDDGGRVDYTYGILPAGNKCTGTRVDAATRSEWVYP